MILDFIRSIWPNIDLALEWMDRYGDKDDDGFIEYARLSAQGIDSTRLERFLGLGLAQRRQLSPARPSLFAKFKATLMPPSAPARRCRWRWVRWSNPNLLLVHAAKLKDRFHERFWCNDLSTYALALDGQKRQCQIKTSNAGQCLYTGIVDKRYAGTVADTLMAADSFSGWGVRTLAAAEARFNPMAYHNGSVWPHDNALIAAGLARYGFKDEANRIFAGLFQASLFVEYRLPELFCGFEKQNDNAPVPYPVACSPQAWSAAAVLRC